jgi:hypothetical protein
VGFDHGAEYLECPFFGRASFGLFHSDDLDASGCERKPYGNQYSSDLHRAGARPTAHHFVVVHGAGDVGDAVVFCGVGSRNLSEE